ncbi:MAG TPA: hypothetical protein VMG09_11255, partial [Bacteroidota bacterium]|nr:hypothetical protein [Bacteroidota bacterium]
MKTQKQISAKVQPPTMHSLPDEPRGMSRRRFIKLAGVSALGVSSWRSLRFSTRGVSIVRDQADPIADSPPSLWALMELEKSLTSRGVDVHRCSTFDQARAGDVIVAAAGLGSSVANGLLQASRTSVPKVPEALGLVPAMANSTEVLLACGYDVRGLVYALLELADRVTHTEEPLDALSLRQPVVEQPANDIRSNARLFVSETEDKPWFNDREMWGHYLTMLAAQRFNRFNLSFGIGYDFLQNVTDAYFLFAYPFFLALPGYAVRVPQLPIAERENNLAMLKFISDETVARGLQFQLGLWMHGYEWLNSPNANYTIEGLTHETHGPYCRDALRQLL